MSREAHWRNQRRTKPKAHYACELCGAPTYSALPLPQHTHDLRRLDMTSGDIDAFLGKTEPPRDRWGRPLITPPGGGKPKAYTRCTTYVGALEDNYNLGLWQQRMVALGLAQRDDLMLAVAALTPDDKDDLNKLCEAAREAAAASAGATIGTALHKMCERLDRGDKFVIPAAAKADIDAYKQTTKHIKWLRIEELLVNDALEVAGTPDRIGLAPGQALPQVFDIKTGSIQWGLAKIAMQLAMYARSQAYDVDLGTREIVNVDLNEAVIIHLPAGEGRCELVPVDIAQGWEGVQLAREVRAWRKRKNFTPKTSLADLIAQASTAEQLRALWAAHSHEWTPELTALSKERIAALTAA